MRYPPADNLTARKPSMELHPAKLAHNAHARDKAAAIRRANAIEEAVRRVVPKEALQCLGLLIEPPAYITTTVETMIADIRAAYRHITTNTS